MFWPSVSTSRVGFYSGDRLIHSSGSYVVAADLGSSAFHPLYLITLITEAKDKGIFSLFYQREHVMFLVA